MSKKTSDKRTLLFNYLKDKEGLEEKQLEAVTSEEKLIAVSAGAGSGKTLTLAWRFIWLVSVLEVPLNSILTITFTEKAAAEMKERIEKILKRLVLDLPAMSDTFNDIIDRMDDAYISTIHAFAMRVMKESGLFLDLDPNARIITNAENASLWLTIERALDYQEEEVLLDQLPKEWKERAQKILSSSELEDLLNTFGAKTISESAEKFISSYASRGYSPEDVWSMAENMEAEDDKIKALLLERLLGEWQEAQSLWIEELIPHIKGQTNLDKEKAKFPQRLLWLHNKWKEPIDETNAPDFIMDLFGNEGPLRALQNGKVKKAADEFLKETLGLSLKEFRDGNTGWFQAASFIKEGVPHEEKRARMTLIKVFSVLWKYVERARYNRGTLSFDDLIRFALWALDRDERYAKKFAHILVDEFQDTDGLQDLMLKAIRNKGDSTLFIVGDLQQSIYRFRHAQPKVFWEYIRESHSSSCAKSINLDISFRSRGAVMEKVNNMFSKIWPSTIAKDIQKPFMPLEAPKHHHWWQKRQKSTVEPFKLIIATSCPDKEDKEKIDQLRARALESLGHFIVQSVEGKKTIWDKDEKGNFILRSLRYRDFAILVPSRTQYDAIENVLIEKLGLPVYFEGNRSFYGRGETKDISFLLKALANPEDDLATASFLCSPLSGLPIEEASSLVKEHKKADNESCSLIFLFQRNHPEEWKAFERLRKVAKVKGASWALASLLEDGRILLAYPSWKRRRIAANLRKAIDVIREYETFVDPSLEGTAAYMERATYLESDLQEADILGENDDMIRVMTVHAAKGLEFPVVAVVGLENSSNKRNDSILPSKWLGVAISKLPEEWLPQKEQKLLSKDIHSLFESQEILEEQERLLYVACTRAKDSLILCGVSNLDDQGRLKPKKNSWLELILLRMEELMEEESVKILYSDQQNQGAQSPKQPEPSCSLGPIVTIEKKPLVEETFLENITASIYALYRFCPHAYRMKYRQGLDIAWESPTEDGRGGSDMGSLTHWILKDWDYSQESLDVLLPLDEAKKMERLKIIPPYLRPLYRESSTLKIIRAWLSKLAESPLASQVRASSKVMKELPFRVDLGGKTEMTGYMDLVFEDQGAFWIVDYKITAPQEASKALYKDQLLFYGTALWKMTQKPPKGLGIYHLPEGTLENVPFSLDLLEEEAQKIQEVASLACWGPFTPNETNCSICPWRGSCTALAFTMRKEELS